MKLTKQGVPDLSTPSKNERKTKQSDTCFHQMTHDRECAGCWAVQFGGYDRSSHWYICTKCSHTESRD